MNSKIIVNNVGIFSDSGAVNNTGLEWWFFVNKDGSITPLKC